MTENKNNVPKVKRPVRRRAGGPRSPEGKAITSRNALTHGLNSQLVVIEGEDADEFEALFQGLVDDFRPQGTTETLILHRVASLVWKQRRLDRFEHDQIQQAALAPLGIAEIFRKMNRDWKIEMCRPHFEFLDTYDESDADKAEEWISECEEFQRVSHIFGDLERCKIAFPGLTAFFLKQANDINQPVDLVFGLGNPDPDPDALELALDEVKGIERRERAIYFLVTHRDEIYRARAALRAEKIAQAWNLERSHRYHSLLESQLFKALKELRVQQAWRTSRTKMSESAATGCAINQQLSPH